MGWMAPRKPGAPEWSWLATPHPCLCLHSTILIQRPMWLWPCPSQQSRALLGHILPQLVTAKTREVHVPSRNSLLCKGGHGGPEAGRSRLGGSKDQRRTEHWPGCQMIWARIPARASICRLWKRRCSLVCLTHKVGLGSDVTRELHQSWPCWLERSPSTLPGVVLPFLCGIIVVQSRPTLCNPTDCSTPGLPVLHHLPELALWRYPPLKIQAYFAP